MNNQYAIDALETRIRKARVTIMSLTREVELQHGKEQVDHLRGKLDEEISSLEKAIEILESHAYSTARPKFEL